MHIALIDQVSRATSTTVEMALRNCIPVILAVFPCLRCDLRHTPATKSGRPQHPCQVPELPHRVAGALRQQARSGLY